MTRALASGLAALYFLTNVAAGHAAESNFWKDRRRAASLQWGEPTTAAPSRGGALYARLPTAPSQGPDLSSLWEQPVHRVSQDLAEITQKNIVRGPDARLVAVAQAVAPFGQVRRVKASPVPGAPLILHVQDVHGNLDAQRNMSGMVLALAQKQSPLVGLEGASGAFELESFHAYPDLDIVKSVADYFLEKDLIGGPEHAGLVAPKPLNLWGVEDPALYLAHVAAVKDSLAGRGRADAFLGHLASAVEALKKNHYSPALRDFDKNQTLYERDQRGLGEYVENLKGFQKTLSAQEFPNVEKLLVAARREKTMDFEAVENERRALVEGLATRLSVPELQDLVRRSLDLKAGTIRQRDYQTHLRDLCARHKLALSRFPRLVGYMDYVADSESIEREALLNELDRLETAAQDALARTPVQRDIVSLTRDLSRLSKLVANEMTPADWSAYEPRRAAMSRLGERLKALPGGRAVETPADWEGFVRPYEEFCRKALARNSALADRTLEKMKSERKGTALLVAGGFHTDGLVDLLAARGATVVVLTPKIGPVEGASNYLDVFARDPLPVEKIFAGEPIALKTRCGLGGGELAGEQTARVHAAVAGRTLMVAWEDLRGLGHNARTILRELRERLLSLSQEVAGLSLLQPRVQAVGADGLTFSYRAPNGWEESVSFRATDDGIAASGHRRSGPGVWWRGATGWVARLFTPRPASRAPAPEAPLVGEGSFFLVRDHGQGRFSKEVKEVVGPRGGVQYKLSEADRERLAQLAVEFSDRVREPVARASGGRVLIPVFERRGRTLWVDRAPGGSRATEAPGDRAAFLDAMRGADIALGLEGLNDPIYTADGWRVHVDREFHNFYFDAENPVVTWIDPVTVWPPADRQILSAGAVETPALSRTDPLAREWAVAWRESFGFLRPVAYFRAHPTWTAAERWVGALLIVGLWGVFGETSATVFQWVGQVSGVAGVSPWGALAAGVTVGWAVTVPLHAGWNLLTHRVNAVLASRGTAFRLPRLTVHEDMTNEFEAIESNIEKLKDSLTYLEKEKGNPSIRLKVVELYIQTVDRLTRLMADMNKYLPKASVQKFRSRIFASQDWLPPTGQIINFIELIGRDGNFQTAQGFLGQIGRYSEFVNPLDAIRLKETQTVLRQAALQAETQRMKGVRPNGKQVRSIVGTLALSKTEEHWLEVYAALERGGLDVSFDRMAVVGGRSAAEYKRLWDEGLGGFLTDNWAGGVRPLPGDETLLDDLETALQIHAEEEPTTDGFLKKWPTAEDFSAQIAKTANVPEPLVGLWLKLEKKGEYAKLVKKLTSASPMVIVDREGVEWRVMAAPRVFEKFKPQMGDTVSRLARKLIELGDAGQSRGAEYSRRGVLREKWATSSWIFGKKFDAQKTLMIYWFGSGSEAHEPGDSFAANKDVERKVFENADNFNPSNGVVVMSDLTESRVKPTPAGALPRVVEWLKARGNDTAAAIRKAPLIESGLFSAAFLVPFALAVFGVDGASWAVGGVYALMNAYFGLQHTRVYRFQNGQWVEGLSTWKTKAWLMGVGAVVHAPLLLLALNPLAGPVGMLAMYAGAAGASVALHRLYNWAAAKLGLPAATVTRDPIESLNNMARWGQYKSPAVKQGFDRLMSPEFNLREKPEVATALDALFRISNHSSSLEREYKTGYLFGVPYEPWGNEELAGMIFERLKTNEKSLIALGNFFNGFVDTNRGEDWVYGLLAKAMGKSGNEFDSVVEALVESENQVSVNRRNFFLSISLVYYYSHIIDQAGRSDAVRSRESLEAVDRVLSDVQEALDFETPGLLNIYNQIMGSADPVASANALRDFLRNAKLWQRGVLGHTWKTFVQMLAQAPVSSMANPVDFFVRLRELFWDEEGDRREQAVADEAVSAAYFVGAIYPEIRDELLTGLFALGDKLGKGGLSYAWMSGVSSALSSAARGEPHVLSDEMRAVPGARLFFERFQILANLKLPTEDLRYLQVLTPPEIKAFSQMEVKEEPEQRWSQTNEFLGFAARVLGETARANATDPESRGEAVRATMDRLKVIAERCSGDKEGSLINETENEIWKRTQSNEVLLHLAEKKRVATVGLLNEAFRTYQGVVLGGDPFFDFFTRTEKNIDYVRLVESFYRWTLVHRLADRNELQPFVDALGQVLKDWSSGQIKSKELAKKTESIVAEAERAAVVRYFGTENKMVVDSLDEKHLTQLVVASSLAASLLPGYGVDEDRTSLVKEMTNAVKAWLSGHASRGSVEGANSAAREHGLSIVGNAQEIEGLKASGYSPALWEDGVTVDAREVRPMTEEARVAQIRRHTEQLVDLAHGLGLVPTDKRAEIEATLGDYESASKFVNETILGNQERVIERFAGEGVQFPERRFEQIELHLNEMLVTLKTLSATQKLSPESRSRVSVRIQKNLLDELSAGHRIPGCFNPFGGAHREMPVVHALETSSMFAMAYNEETGEMIANVVLVMTPQGVLVFGDYNSSGFDLTPVWQEAWKKLAALTPGVVLTPVSAGRRGVDPVAESFSGKTLIKGWNLFPDAYFDFGVTNSKLRNAEFYLTEAVRLTQASLAGIGAPVEIPLPVVPVGVPSPVVPAETPAPVRPTPPVVRPPPSPVVESPAPNVPFLRWAYNQVSRGQVVMNNMFRVEIYHIANLPAGLRNAAARWPNESYFILNRQANQDALQPLGEGSPLYLSMPTAMTNPLPQSARATGDPAVGVPVFSIARVGDEITVVPLFEGIAVTAKDGPDTVAVRLPDPGRVPKEVSRPEPGRVHSWFSAPGAPSRISVNGVVDLELIKTATGFSLRKISQARPIPGVDFMEGETAYFESPLGEINILPQTAAVVKSASGGRVYFYVRMEGERFVVEKAGSQDSVAIKSDGKIVRLAPPAGAMPAVVDWLKARGNDTADAIRKAPWVESGLFSLAFVVPFAMVLLGAEGAHGAVGAVYGLMNAYFGLKHDRVYRSVNGVWTEGPSSLKTKLGLAAVGAVIHLPLLLATLNPLAGPVGSLLLYGGAAAASVGLHRLYNVVAQRLGWAAATVAPPGAPSFWKAVRSAQTTVFPSPPSDDQIMRQRFLRDKAESALWDLIGTVSPTRMVGILQKTTGFNNLELTGNISVDYFSEGVHKYVFKVTVERMTAQGVEPVSFLLAMKKAKSVNSIAQVELDDLQQLRGLGAPLFGGTFTVKRSGEMFFLEEFIEGLTGQQLKDQGLLTNTHRRSIAATLTRIGEKLGGRTPSDSTLKNFIIRPGANQAIMVDIGSGRTKTGPPASGFDLRVFLMGVLKHLTDEKSADQVQAVVDGLLEGLPPPKAIVFVTTLANELRRSPPINNAGMTHARDILMAKADALSSATAPRGPPAGAIPGVVDWLRAQGLNTAEAIRKAPLFESGLFSIAFLAVLAFAMAGMDGGSWAAGGVYGLMNAYFGYKHETVFRYQNGGWVETRATWKTRVGLMGVGLAIHAPLLLSAWSAPFVGGLWFVVLYPFLAAVAVGAHQWYNERAKERGWAAATVPSASPTPSAVIGQGSFFVVTDAGNGELRKELKEYVGPPSRLYRLSEAEREKAAALVVEHTNRIRREVNEQLRVRNPEGLGTKNFLPYLRREGRFIFVDTVEGVPFSEAVQTMSQAMAEEARRDIRGAVRAASDVFDLKYDQMLEREDGWRIGVDNRPDNFLFVGDDLTGWIDAISPWPPETHRVSGPGESPPTGGPAAGTGVRVDFDGPMPRVDGWASPLERAALIDVQSQVEALVKGMPPLRSETRNGFQVETMDRRGYQWPASHRGQDGDAQVFEILSNGKSYRVKIAFGMGAYALANAAAGAAPAAGVPGVRALVDFAVTDAPLRYSYLVTEAPIGQSVGAVLMPDTQNPVEARDAVLARIEAIPAEHVRAAQETVRALADRGLSVDAALTRYDNRLGFVFEGLSNDADPLHQQALKWFPVRNTPDETAREVVAKVLSAVAGVYPSNVNPYFDAARGKVAATTLAPRPADRRLATILVDNLRRAWREQISVLRPENLFPAGFSLRQVAQSAFLLVGLLSATMDAVGASVGVALGGKMAPLAHTLSFGTVAGLFVAGWRAVTSPARGASAVDVIRTDEAVTNPFGWRVDGESLAEVARQGLAEDLGRLLLGGVSRPVWLGFKDLRRSYRSTAAAPAESSRASFRAHLADMARGQGRDYILPETSRWGVRENEVFRAATLRKGQAWGGITLSRWALAELILATATPFQRAMPWFHRSARWALGVESDFLERGAARSQTDRLTRAARAIAVLRAAGFSLSSPNSFLNQEVSQEHDRRLLLNAAGVANADVSLVENAYNAALEKIAATNLWNNAATAAFIRLNGGRAFHREGVPAGGPTGTLYFNIDALVQADDATEEQRGKVAESLEGVLSALSGEYLRDRLVLTTSLSGDPATTEALIARLTREFGPSFRALRDLTVLTGENAPDLYEAGVLRLSVLADHAKGRGTGEFEVWTHDAKKVLRDKPGLDKILVVDILDIAVKFDRMLRQMRFLATNA